MTKIAFVFPGQGSQKVGMGRAWAERFPVARQTFEEADEVFGEALSQLCWEGPEEDLKLTANTQPALLATSIAVYRAVRESGLDALLLAGHSLGEYTALVAAESLAFGDALRLVRRRGQLMQEAVPVGEGGMAAILGLSTEQVEEVAQAAVAGSGQVCALANLNCEGQTVLAGHLEPLERVLGLAKEAGARKAVLLPVSAPFHSPLMAPAREALTPLLAETQFHDPRVPVVSNVDAAPVTTGEAARAALERQVDAPVRWTESVAWMGQERGIDRFVEVGPGKVLTGLGRRIVREAKHMSLPEPEDLDKLLDKLEAAGEG